MELSFFIEEVWLASCPSPLSIFLSPPRFLLPGSPSSILPYTRRPSLLQRGNIFHNISTCAANIASSYMIFRTDPWIFDFPLQIPLSPILTSRWIVTIFTFQHSPRTGEIFLLRKTPATQHKDKNLSESIMFSYKVRNWLEKHPKGKSQFLFLLRVRRNES